MERAKVGSLERNCGTSRPVRTVSVVLEVHDSVDRKQEILDVVGPRLVEYEPRDFERLEVFLRSEHRQCREGLQHRLDDGGTCARQERQLEQGLFQRVDRVVLGRELRGERITPGSTRPTTDRVAMTI